MLQSEAEILKKIDRRFPTERTRRKVVILLLTNRRLTLEVTQRIKMMGGVKLLVILTVSTLQLSIYSTIYCDLRQCLNTTPLYNKFAKARKVAGL